jgi:L-asparaginase
MKITFVTTGGTIDKIYFDAKSHYEVGESLIPEILKESNATIEYEIVNLMRKDSLEMSEHDRQMIRETVEQTPGRFFVVTHGTDTMIETARALEGTRGKVIVLTGALAPARFKQSDASFNVGAAVTAVQCLPEGVYVAMNGRVFKPGGVKKNLERNCFEEIPS